jgi:hypothetical protein
MATSRALSCYRWGYPSWSGGQLRQKCDGVDVLGWHGGEVSVIEGGDLREIELSARA